MKNKQEAVEKCWIWNSVTLIHLLLAHSRVATIHECKLNFMLGQVTFATVLSKRFMILYNLYRYIDVRYVHSAVRYRSLNEMKSVNKTSSQLGQQAQGL